MCGHQHPVLPIQTSLDSSTNPHRVGTVVSVLQKGKKNQDSVRLCNVAQNQNSNLSSPHNMFTWLLGMPLKASIKTHGGWGYQIYCCD